ncbi:MAG: class I SAM-dependent methyltransferase [Proteobacteria bacterium]|nr:class I SAM-dependent methyltransferase [Pseudomonadota bacterium]
MPNAWIEFWDRPNRIYVNDRHLAAHFRILADEILSILPHRPGLRILDFGCGEALEAARVAARVDRLFLYDAAPTVRSRLAGRFAAERRIAVIDEHGLAGIADGTLDLIFVSSVVQYLDRDGLMILLATARRLLATGGTLVVADVIGPETRVADDIRSLLAMGARNGFLAEALLGLFATLFSDYRRLRGRIGLSVHSEAAFLATLAAAGLEGHVHPRNLGENPARRTYFARKAA